ncbi:MAG: aminotransferase class IV family protein [Dokdonella sp.]
MTLPPLDRAEINGSIATIDAVRTPALVNYGHFTSMQVQDGCVRGLDLHLQRLQRSTQELFGEALDIAQTRAWMRQIIDGDIRPMSLRVNVFSRSLNRDRPLEPARPDVLVTTSAARSLPRTPLRVGSVHYQREQPHLKHVGTFGLFQQKRLAQARGFDDALFVDACGAVAEGSIWNIGFLDDSGIVWPDAPALPGISMLLLQQGLRDSNVASVTRYVDIDEIDRFRGAFFTNSSCAVMPIACIDAIEFAIDADALALLEGCYALNPWQPL